MHINSILKLQKDGIVLGIRLLCNRVIRQGKAALFRKHILNTKAIQSASHRQRKALECYTIFTSYFDQKLSLVTWIVLVTACQNSEGTVESSFFGV